MKKILLIDNYDSFTYNLVQYFQQLNCEVFVRRNDEISAAEAVSLQPDYLVFSPGPGTVENPKDIGNGLEIFGVFRGRIPILGVCLGHQMIGKIFDGTIKLIAPVHGKRWNIKVLENAQGLFKGFSKTFEGMRYHSMVVDRKSFPQDLTITAETADEDRLVMALENKEERIFGVQFHPESIGTKEGMKMLENFLNQ